MTELANEMNEGENLLASCDEVCEIHPDEFHNAFCGDCVVPCCKMCMINHNSHTITNFSDAVEEIRKELLTHIHEVEKEILPANESDLDEIRQYICKYNRNIKMIEHCVNAKRVSITVEINKLCDQMIEESIKIKKNDIAKMRETIRNWEDQQNHLHNHLKDCKSKLYTKCSDIIHFIKEGPDPKLLNPLKAEYPVPPTFIPGSVNVMVLKTLIGIIKPSDEVHKVSITVLDNDEKEKSTSKGHNECNQNEIAIETVNSESKLSTGMIPEGSKSSMNNNYSYSTDQRKYRRSNRMSGGNCHDFSLSSPSYVPQNECIHVELKHSSQSNPTPASEHSEKSEQKNEIENQCTTRACKSFLNNSHKISRMEEWIDNQSRFAELLNAMKTDKDRTKNVRFQSSTEDMKYKRCLNKREAEKQFPKSDVDKHENSICMNSPFDKDSTVYHQKSTCNTERNKQRQYGDQNKGVYPSTATKHHTDQDRKIGSLRLHTSKAIHDDNGQPDNQGQKIEHVLSSHHNKMSRQHEHLVTLTGQEKIDDLEEENVTHGQYIDKRPSSTQDSEIKDMNHTSSCYDTKHNKIVTKVQNCTALPSSTANHLNHTCTILQNSGENNSAMKYCVGQKGKQIHSSFLSNERETHSYEKLGIKNCAKSTALSNTAAENKSRYNSQCSTDKQQSDDNWKQGKQSTSNCVLKISLNNTHHGSDDQMHKLDNKSKNLVSPWKQHISQSATIKNGVKETSKKFQLLCHSNHKSETLPKSVSTKQIRNDLQRTRREVSSTKIHSDLKVDVQRSFKCKLKVDNIAPTSENSIWVGSWGKKSLKKYDYYGAELKSTHTDFCVLSFTCNKSNELIVVDSTNNCIQKLMPSGDFVKLCNTFPLLPRGILINKFQEIILSGCATSSEIPGKLVRYTPDGNEKLQEICRDEKGIPIYQTPNKISQNVNGDYCVIDEGFGYIVTVSEEGKLRWSYKGTQGPGRKRTFYPTDLCCDENQNLIISDQFNDVIDLVDKDGKFLAFLLTKEQNILAPRGLSINHFGTLFVGQTNGTVFTIKYTRTSDK